jgi:fermentation-respiration switch protein FrsA (DUF1100 family)
MAYLRFSYRGCGEGEEKSEGDFDDTTLSSRILDYRAAIDFVRETDIDSRRLGVIGSSFGGMVAVAADERVRAMVLLATPYSIPAGPGGDYIQLGSGRWLKRAFFDDLRRYDIGRAVERIHCPILIIQGSKDDVVPMADAYEIYRQANQPKQIEIIEGGSHSFDSPEHLERVINLSLDWFKKYL